MFTKRCPHCGGALRWRTVFSWNIRSQQCPSCQAKLDTNFVFAFIVSQIAMVAVIPLFGLAFPMVDLTGVSSELVLGLLFLAFLMFWFGAIPMFAYLFLLKVRDKRIDK
jgi:hypothetical protein